MGINYWVRLSDSATPPTPQPEYLCIRSTHILPLPAEHLRICGCVVLACVL